MSLIFIPEENVVYLFAYESPKTQEFSINTMQNGFKEISFSWIF